VKLTEKDIAFLGTLKRLMDHADLRVVRRSDRLILRQNYGDHIASNFRMTRQGVRWRFQRTMDMYISAFQTILLIEQTLGSEVREMAIAASRARHEIHESPANVDAGTSPAADKRKPNLPGAERE